MKIDRLIGILSVLLQEEKTTAPELAERFEVSRRTINRDIEDLCKAGIPILAVQGSGGGISIMDGYRMDRTILTSRDMQMILAGLRSLDSVSGTRYYGQLMEKIQTGSSEFISGKDSILIDLSSWYKASLTPKIDVILSSIENRKLLEFRYYSPSRESSRTIEPYYLVFKWSSWYVWGWCTTKEDFRLFKLNRMDSVAETDQSFVCRDVPLPDLSNEKIFPGGIKVKVLFSPEVKWRLISLARVIGANKRQDGYLEGDGYLVSWCVGHLVELSAPERYDERFAKWRLEDLPILPEHWLYEVSQATRKQYQILKSLMERSDVTSIVCATDAGREGELIFRLVYNQARCKKPFERLWISSMEDAAIREGFKKLKPGTAYDALYEAALC